MTWRKSVVISGHSAPVYACTVFGDFIYSTAGDRFVTRWNTSDGKQDSFTVKLDAPAYTLGIVASERLLIIGCTNGTIIAINTDSKQLVWVHNFLGKALFSVVDCPVEKMRIYDSGIFQPGNCYRNGRHITKPSTESSNAATKLSLFLWIKPSKSGTATNGKSHSALNSNKVGTIVLSTDVWQLTKTVLSLLVMINPFFFLNGKFKMEN